MKKSAQSMIRFFMLAAGLILLLTVVIPHHHHADGRPCIHLVDQDQHEEHNNHDGMHPHPHSDCDCSGHTIAYTSGTQQGHSSEQGMPVPALPLFTLINSTSPLRAICITDAFYSDKAVYIESLHDTCIPGATGLRAPPPVIG